jgi:hypothetical protein
MEKTNINHRQSMVLLWYCVFVCVLCVISQQQRRVISINTFTAARRLQTLCSSEIVIFCSRQFTFPVIDISRQFAWNFVRLGLLPYWITDGELMETGFP